MNRPLLNDSLWGEGIPGRETPDPLSDTMASRGPRTISDANDALVIKGPVRRHQYTKFDLYMAAIGWPYTMILILDYYHSRLRTNSGIVSSVSVWFIFSAINFAFVFWRYTHRDDETPKKIRHGDVFRFNLGNKGGRRA